MSYVRKKKIGKHEYLYEQKSVREGDKVRTQHVRYIGKHEPQNSVAPKYSPLEHSEDKIAKERFDLKNLEKVGEGSDRIVYKIDEEHVLKIAKTARGLEQNDSEGDNFLNLIPKEYEKGRDYVVVQYAKKDVKKTNKLLKPLKKFGAGDFENKTSELQDVFHKLDEKYEGFSDVLNYDLLWGDFISSRNWGWIGDKPYLTDAGTLNKNMMKVNDFTKYEWREIVRKRRSIRHYK